VHSPYGRSVQVGSVHLYSLIDASIGAVVPLGLAVFASLKFCVLDMSHKDERTVLLHEIVSDAAGNHCGCACFHWQASPVLQPLGEAKNLHSPLCFSFVATAAMGALSDCLGLTA
jgi:hypothetical protein